LFHEPLDVLEDPFRLCEISPAKLANLLVAACDKDLLMAWGTSMKKSIGAFLAAPRPAALSDLLAAPGAFTTGTAEQASERIGVEALQIPQRRVLL
jgi:hypothetical protein